MRQIDVAQRATSRHPVPSFAEVPCASATKETGGQHRGGPKSPRSGKVCYATLRRYCMSCIACPGHVSIHVIVHQGLDARRVSPQDPKDPLPLSSGSGRTAGKAAADTRKAHYQVYLACRVAAHEQPSLGIESQTSRPEAAAGTLRVIGVCHDLSSCQRAAGWLAVGPEIDAYDTISVRRGSVPVDRVSIKQREREEAGICHPYQLPWSDTKAEPPSAVNFISNGAVCAGSTTRGAWK